MEPYGEKTLFADAFERVVHALPHHPEFSGLEIVGARARRHHRDTALEVVVDRDGGIDVATCERIAARINAALDAFPEPYTLAVESAGLERALMRPSDYDRFAGRDVKVVTTLAIGGAKTFRGRLNGVHGGNIVLLNSDGELAIPLAAVKSANLEYDPRADLARAKREKNAHR